MKVVYTISEVRESVKQYKREGLTVGFVPTMGYLHEGHGSLIKRAKEENDIVVVSTFVNPIQFGPNEDLDKYPRDQKRDEEVCEAYGGDIMFLPSVEEMYPEERKTTVSVEGLTAGLCGAKRPGHFNGVTTVVTKLFNIVLPDRAYFGQKDAQQLMVIKKMVRDLNNPVEVIGCPIVREEDGLAKSSRNKYLGEEERKAALVLSRSLKEAKKAIDNGEKNSKNIISIIESFISKEPLAKVDYVNILDINTIEDVEEVGSGVLIAMAVYIGKTRLIDNMILE